MGGLTSSSTFADLITFLTTTLVPLRDPLLLRLHRWTGCQTLFRWFSPIVFVKHLQTILSWQRKCSWVGKSEQPSIYTLNSRSDLMLFSTLVFSDDKAALNNEYYFITDSTVFSFFVWKWWKSSLKEKLMLFSLFLSTLFLIGTFIAFYVYLELSSEI